MALLPPNCQQGHWHCGGGGGGARVGEAQQATGRHFTHSLDTRWTRDPLRLVLAFRFCFCCDFSLTTQATQLSAISPTFTRIIANLMLHWVFPRLFVVHLSRISDIRTTNHVCILTLTIVVYVLSSLEIRLTRNPLLSLSVWRVKMGFWVLKS